MFASTTLQDLNHLPVRTLFWRYATPSIVAMLVTGIYYMVDGMFVGRYVGAHGLAAINLVYPAIMLITGLGSMLAMGGATRMALLQGAGDNEGARRALASSIWLLLAAGTVLTVAAILLRDPILRLLRADIDAQLLQHAHSYLSWILAGSILLIGQIMVAALLRNDGRPQLATLLLSSGALLNIVLCYWFVARLGLGLAGAAMSTLIAEAVVVVIGLGYFFTRYSRLRLYWRDLRPDWQQIPALFTLGLPHFLMELNLAVLLFAHNYQLLRYSNETSVAAFAVAGYTEAMFVLVVHGLALGLQPLLSYATGAGQQARIRASLQYGLRITLLISGIAWFLVEVFPEVIASIYSQGDNALLALAAHTLQIHLIMLPMDGLLIVGIVALQSMAQTRQAIAMTCSKTILLIPALLLMPRWLGMDGVLLAVPLVNLLLGSVMAGLLWRLLRHLGKKVE